MAESLGDAVLELRADGTQLQKDMQSARSDAADTLKSAGAAMSQTGAKLTRSVTMPIVGAGAAVIGLGQKFETNMSRITGLVGISAEETAKLGKSVLELAPKVGKGPEELSDALFTVTSAGFRGAEAMGVLEAASKASAAGLGDTRSIAEAATGVINTYGAEVISAAEATDIVTATARAGNFATEDLAGALGRVTPFAEAAGASFEDVGGAIALLTRQNNDANQSVTQTAALMRAFSAPTKQTIDALDELGLSTDQVREMMSEKGLAGTLQELDERLGGNRDKLREIIPDSQGLSAAFTILDSDAETLNDTFGATADAAGITNEAFAAAEQTTRQKFNKAMAGAQAQLIEISADVLPAVSDMLEDVIAWLGRAAEWWGEQDDATKQNILRFVALVAAIGPVLFIGGKLVSLIGTVITVVKALSTAMLFLAANPVVLIIAAIALLAAGLVIAYQKSETFRDLVNRAFEGVKDGAKRMAANVIGGLRMLLDAALAFAEGMLENAIRAFGWVPGLGDKLRGAKDKVAEFRKGANEELSRIQTQLRYDADVSPAMREVAALRRSLQTMPKVSTVTVGGARGGRVMHEGGFVPGPRNMEVPAVLQGGEFVMSHEMLDRGQGAPGRSLNVNVTGQMEPIDEDRLVTLIQRAEMLEGA